SVRGAAELSLVVTGDDQDVSVGRHRDTGDRSVDVGVLDRLWPEGVHLEGRSLPVRTSDGEGLASGEEGEWHYRHPAYVRLEPPLHGLSPCARLKHRTACPTPDPAGPRLRHS